MFIGPEVVTALCEVEEVHTEVEEVHTEVEEVHTEVAKGDAKGEMVFLRPCLVLSKLRSQFVFVTMIKYSKSTLDRSYYSVAGKEK